MIQISNLHFGYKLKSPIFSNVDLQINASGIVGLFGKNGAGKTTFMKLLCGALLPNEGEIRSISMNASKRQPAFLEQIFFVPDHVELPHYKAQKYIDLFANDYPLFNHETFKNIANNFELDLNKKLSNTSFGQQKKFLIAFALATNCRLLLLDEPTNGLDIPSKKTFRKVVSSHLNDDQLIMISTHYVSEVYQIIDQVVILNNNQVVFNGNTEIIANDYIFDNVQEYDPAETIYAEEEMSGYKVIRRNINNTDSKVDIELYFNAVVSGSIHQ